MPGRWAAARKPTLNAPGPGVARRTGSVAAGVAVRPDEGVDAVPEFSVRLGTAVGGEVELYEPVHGSAPDIAGRGIANPCGAIASGAMMLRHSAKLEQEASDIERAIQHVLESGYRTADIALGGHATSTCDMGELICEAVTEIADMRYAYHAV